MDVPKVCFICILTSVIMTSSHLSFSGIFIFCALCIICDKSKLYVLA